MRLRLLAGTSDYDLLETGQYLGNVLRLSQAVALLFHEFLKGDVVRVGFDDLCTRLNEPKVFTSSGQLVTTTYSE